MRISVLASARAGGCDGSEEGPCQAEAEGEEQLDSGRTQTTVERAQRPERRTQQRTAEDSVGRGWRRRD